MRFVCFSNPLHCLLSVTQNAVLPCLPCYLSVTRSGGGARLIFHTTRPFQVRVQLCKLAANALPQTGGVCRVITEARFDTLQTRVQPGCQTGTRVLTFCPQLVVFYFPLVHVCVSYLLDSSQWRLILMFSYLLGLCRLQLSQFQHVGVYWYFRYHGWIC